MTILIGGPLLIGWLARVSSLTRYGVLAGIAVLIYLFFVEAFGGSGGGSPTERGGGYRDEYTD
jgi:ABC-type Na+ efflux pump permease subunit